MCAGRAAAWTCNQAGFACDLRTPGAPWGSQASPPPPIPALPLPPPSPRQPVLAADGVAHVLIHQPPRRARVPHDRLQHDAAAAAQRAEHAVQVHAVLRGAAPRCRVWGSGERASGLRACMLCLQGGGSRPKTQPRQRCRCPRSALRVHAQGRGGGGQQPPARRLRCTWLRSKSSRTTPRRRVPSRSLSISCWHASRLLRIRTRMDACACAWGEGGRGGGWCGAAWSGDELLQGARAAKATRGRCKAHMRTATRAMRPQRADMVPVRAAVRQGSKCAPAQPDADEREVLAHGEKVAPLQEAWRLNCARNRQPCIRGRETWGDVDCGRL